jgi:serine/threonine protein kinase
MTATQTSGLESGMYCPSCEATFAEGELCPNDNTRLVKLETEDAMLGLVLDGRYTLVAKLGAGGMGAVYRATQHSVGRDVAVKVMAPNLVADPRAIKRFLREAKLASRFSHPNAVGVLDFGQTAEGVFFLVMELVEGESLADVLVRDPVLPMARIFRIATQVCDALDGAHAHQIVHRDLKPANVMVLAGGRDLVKVLDFGIAKSLVSQDTMMTHTGVVVGTPAFMAPEVATGSEIDVRADLYSLGCMLYQMAVGNLPFVAASLHEVMLMQHDQLPPPMYGVPEPFAAVVMKLLEKQRENRYPTAAATREALEAAENVMRDGRAATPLPFPSGETRILTVTPPTPSAVIATPTPPPIQPYVWPPTSTSVPQITPQRPLPPPGVRKAKSGRIVVIAVVVALVGAVGAYAIIRQTQSPDEEPPPPVATPMNTTAPPVVPDAMVVAVPAAAQDAGIEPDAAAAIDAGHHHKQSTTPHAGSGSAVEDNPPF